MSFTVGDLVCLKDPACYNRKPGETFTVVFCPRQCWQTLHVVSDIYGTDAFFLPDSLKLVEMDTKTLVWE